MFKKNVIFSGIRLFMVFFAVRVFIASAQTETPIPEVCNDSMLAKIQSGGSLDVNFMGYLASGASPGGMNGNLDTCLWEVRSGMFTFTGDSPNNVFFEETKDSLIFSRGQVHVATSFRIIGVSYLSGQQTFVVFSPSGSYFIDPDRSFMSPGSFVLRVKNSGADSISQLRVNYLTAHRSNQAKYINFNLLYLAGTDHVVADSNYMSAHAVDLSGMNDTTANFDIACYTGELSITGFDAGMFLYLRWLINPAAAGTRGFRDDLGIGPVEITSDLNDYTCVGGLEAENSPRNTNSSVSISEMMPGTMLTTLDISSTTSSSIKPSSSSVIKPTTSSGTGPMESSLSTAGGIVPSASGAMESSLPTAGGIVPSASGAMESFLSTAGGIVPSASGAMESSFSRVGGTVPSVSGAMESSLPTAGGIVPSASGAMESSLPTAGGIVPSASGAMESSLPTAGGIVPSASGAMESSFSTVGGTVPSASGAMESSFSRVGGTVPSVSGAMESSLSTVGGTVPSASGAMESSLSTVGGTVPSARGPMESSLPTAGGTVPSARGESPASGAAELGIGLIPVILSAFLASPGLN